MTPEAARAAMVEGQLVDRGIRDPRVLEVMGRLAREAFVAPALARRAYEDHPLPIGEGQTISQPYIVALMTEALGLAGAERVLEIGTGSGYQTAILAALAREVWSIERLGPLARGAVERLRALGIRNVHVRIGDGSLGWPAHAPFDRILVAAAAPALPPALVAQLGIGGRLVIPVGGEHLQDLLCVERTGPGPRDLRQHVLCPSSFVPLVGAEGHPEPG